MLTAPSPVFYATSWSLISRAYSRNSSARQNGWAARARSTRVQDPRSVRAARVGAHDVESRTPREASRRVAELDKSHVSESSRSSTTSRRASRHLLIAHSARRHSFCSVYHMGKGRTQRGGPGSAARRRAPHPTGREVEVQRLYSQSTACGLQEYDKPDGRCCVRARALHFRYRRWRGARHPAARDGPGREKKTGEACDV